ncbi:MAG: fused MFS/spermidine synthase [Candidatus Coatesbacteria bacterium]|nr:fused MFS/spermidine synthase [Candidatus Coatesbacteria bacterium]
MKSHNLKNIALVFLASFSLMVIELVAGRVIARYLGSSLYTWTAVIAVILGGISLGNYLGGKMADKWEPKKFLGYIFMIAAILSITIPIVNQAISVMDMLTKLHWPIRIFLSVVFVFFIPSCALGCISPIVAKMALLEQKDEIGSTVGTLYAWGAIGSILGTLFTGYFLIAWIGVKAVIVMVSFVLSLLGLWAGPKRWIHGILAIILLVALFLSFTTSEKPKQLAKFLLLQDREDGLYAHDSAYSFIQIYPREKDPQLMVLRLDNLIHSYCHPKNPDHLEYDYEQLYAAITKRVVKDKKNARFMFIGGGGYTLPRYLVHNYPDSFVFVAEIDPVVTDVSYKYLGLTDDPRIATDNRDGRLVVEELCRKGVEKFDCIYADAYNDLSVPYHLTTYEYLSMIRKLLKDDGVYLINIIDIQDKGMFLGATCQTSRAVFPYVRVFAEGASGDPKLRDTFVAVASPKPLELLDNIGTRDDDYCIVCHELESDLIDKLRAKTDFLVLTDDYVPVDRLVSGIIWERRR